MSTAILAGYVAVGLLLIQFMHTLHAQRTYMQKQVRGLEWVSWFEREDPDHADQVRLFWFGGSADEAGENHRLQDFAADENQSDGDPRVPAELPEIQQELDDVPRLVRWPFETLGMHATNLYYCYVMSIVYAVGAFVIVWRLAPSLATVSLITLMSFTGVFVVLHLFSLFFVGSSITLTLLEGNLAFNALVLALRFGEQIPYQTAVGVLQFGAALTVAPLVFWLQFQYDQGHIRYSNFLSMYYIIVPILYSEFLVLVLGLL